MQFLNENHLLRKKAVQTYLALREKWIAPSC